MQILSALFADDIALRSVDGPSTRLDLTGIQFSAVAPEPLPITWAPHLVVMVYNEPHGNPHGVLEVEFFRDDERIARNVQPIMIEPSKFAYRLVRAELEFAEFGTIIANCRVDKGPITTVPYTLLPPESE